MSKLTKLIESHKKAICEFYDIEGLDSINMEIVDFGIDSQGGHHFELDGIEFYLGEDEELENAVDVCIEMEFWPEWEEQGLLSYNVDSIQFDPEEGKGTAYVGLFWDEDVNESLNEGKLWYLGWRGNPQLANGGYYKKFGQLSKAEAKKKENAGYGSMSLTGYETEEEYNKAIEDAKEKGAHFAL